MAKKSNNLPDDRDVYLAFSTVFTGPNSGVRRQSVIKRLVQSSEKRPEVAQFFRKNNHKAVRGAVYNRLKVLLEQQVFTSYLHAEMKFPDLFAANSAKFAERAASEAEAAIQHARAIEKALQINQEAMDEEAGESDDTCTHPEVFHPSNISSLPTSACPAHPQQSNGPTIPELNPLRLPFLTGHKIMVEVQAILERACFDFAKHALPEILVSRGWVCAEAVELNVWASVLQNQGDHLFSSPSMANKEAKSSFYKSICAIRHNAVHRLPMTTAEIGKSLRDGEVLAMLLGDKTAAVKLSIMRAEVQRVVSEMEDYKCMVEVKLNRTLDRIAAERAELDREGEEATNSMIQADKDYQLHVGASLSRILPHEKPRSWQRGTIQLLKKMMPRTLWEDRR